MVARAYGRALSDDEIDDIYSAAWAATLAALRDRGASMADDELRAYVLTAVASHASKELRRRSRKPSSPLGDAHEQVVSDQHAPLPDEIAIGSESRAVARDLLTSLPSRRRAVMLLRYGWGLSPKEVCALVAGLSPRAYRKEVTRGVEDLIERLRQVESGEWCESREPLVRDLVAGTADEEARRQAIKHLEHCQPCSELASRLSSELHDMGTLVGVAALTGSVGLPGSGVLGWISGVIERSRDAAAGILDRAEATIGMLAASGGSRGSGAASAGLIAKVAGIGGAGKVALACAGASAAATACIAAGVVPGVSLRGVGLQERDRPDRAVAFGEPSVRPVTPRVMNGAIRTISASVDQGGAVERARAPRRADTPTEEPSSDLDPKPAPVQPSPVAPVQEFDPVAAQASAPTEAPPSLGAGSGGSTQSGGEAGSAAARNEFGP